MERHQWWHDHNELARVARYLDDNTAMELHQFVDVLEKPWRWTDEYTAACIVDAGAVLYPIYDVESLDVELGHSKSDVPLPGQGPVTLADVIDVCSTFDITAEVFDFNKTCLGKVNGDGEFKAVDESRDMVKLLQKSIEAAAEAAQARRH